MVSKRCETIHIALKKESFTKTGREPPLRRVLNHQDHMRDRLSDSKGSQCSWHTEKKRNMLQSVLLTIGGRWDSVQKWFNIFHKSVKSAFLHFSLKLPVVRRLASLTGRDINMKDQFHSCMSSQAHPMDAASVCYVSARQQILQWGDDWTFPSNAALSPRLPNTTTPSVSTSSVHHLKHLDSF